MEEKLVKKVRLDLMQMIQQAGSGHIGGGLSSVDIYLALYEYANISPANLAEPGRDRIVVSHGHTSAAIYSVLGNLGFFDVKEAIAHFRHSNIYEGHPSLNVPGVEWCSGALGQGLSVGCGFALGARLRELPSRVYVVMGDGEQAKGQLCEAREFAAKYNLANLTAIVDYNRVQSSGTLEEVLPQQIADKYALAGWHVIEVDGHDHEALLAAFREAEGVNKPVAIMANTVMGKGIPAIEDDFHYHGKLLSAEDYAAALQAYEVEYEAAVIAPAGAAEPQIENRVNPGERIVYTAKTDCRSAFGNALLDLAKVNPDLPMAALDCDLAESVKLSALGKEFPHRLIECGIAEENAATVAAALSKMGVLTFFADFGVFGVDETFSQHRMGDINHASVKLVCTHNGLDVGEDGKTHQCVDYVGNLLNLFGFKVLVPADANQTDAMVRYAATHEGNMAILMGRSKLPVITDGEGEPYYKGQYIYGKADWLRKGDRAAILTMGTMVPYALEAAERLAAEGIEVGVMNISTLTEMDMPALREAAATGLIVTYEDHSVHTGLGACVCSALLSEGIGAKVIRLGVTGYGISDTPEENYRAQGLDTDSLTAIVRKNLT